MGELRTFPVPDGLDGMRVDAGVSRLLGISRTAVAASGASASRRTASTSSGVFRKLSCRVTKS